MRVPNAASRRRAASARRSSRGRCSSEECSTSRTSCDTSGSPTHDLPLDELYASAPADFIATRAELVRRLREAGDAAGARELAQRRRPTQAAHAVNELARSDPETLGRLSRSLGPHPHHPGRGRARRRRARATARSRSRAPQPSRCAARSRAGTPRRGRARAGGRARPIPRSRMRRAPGDSSASRTPPVVSRPSATRWVTRCRMSSPIKSERRVRSRPRRRPGSSRDSRSWTRRRRAPTTSSRAHAPR